MRAGTYIVAFKNGTTQIFREATAEDAQGLIAQLRLAVQLLNPPIAIKWRKA